MSYLWAESFLELAGNEEAGNAKQLHPSEADLLSIKELV